jgi:hypothetical protein
MRGHCCLSLPVKSATRFIHRDRLAEKKISGPLQLGRTANLQEAVESSTLTEQCIEAFSNDVRIQADLAVTP